MWRSWKTRASRGMARFSVAPQLDRVIGNLELIPLKLNIAKKDKMGQLHIGTVFYHDAQGHSTGQ